MAKIPTPQFFVVFAVNFPITQKKNGLILISIHIYIELYCNPRPFDGFSHLCHHMLLSNTSISTNFKNWLTIRLKKWSLSYITHHHEFSPVTYLIFVQGTSMDFVRSAFESPANAWLTFSSARRVQRSQALNGARHVSMPISALFKGPGPEILSCFSCRKTYLLCTI